MDSLKLQHTNNPLLKKLHRIMVEKQSNLCVAVNFQTIEEILDYLNIAGQHIVMVKTQLLGRKGDMRDNMKKLFECKKKHNFLLFEDPKFCDGWETIEGFYKENFVQHCDLVTVMPLIGDEIFSAIRKSIKDVDLPEDEPRGCLAVCELSFKGVNNCHAKEYLELASKNRDVCVGIIAQKLQIPEGVDLIKASPGVNIGKSTDGKGQQWNHPEVVVNQGADIIIVGRGIVAAPRDQWERLTREYKEVAFNAYRRRV